MKCSRCSYETGTPSDKLCLACLHDDTRLMLEVLNTFVALAPVYIGPEVSRKSILNEKAVKLWLEEIEHLIELRRRERALIAELEKTP